MRKQIILRKKKRANQKKAIYSIVPVLLSFCCLGNIVNAQEAIHPPGDSLAAQTYELELSLDSTVYLVQGNDSLHLDTFALRLKQVFTDFPANSHLTGRRVAKAFVQVYQVGKVDTFMATPIIEMDSTGFFMRPSSIEALSMKIGFPPKSWSLTWLGNSFLNYQAFPIKISEYFNYEGYEVSLVKLYNSTGNKYFRADSADVCAMAALTIVAPDGRIHYANPLYIIRGNMVYTVDAFLAEENLRLSFSQIEPEKGLLTIKVAKVPPAFTYSLTVVIGNSSP